MSEPAAAGLLTTPPSPVRVRGLVSPRGFRTGTAVALKIDAGTLAVSTRTQFLINLQTFSTRAEAPITTHRSERRAGAACCGAVNQRAAADGPMRRCSAAHSSRSSGATGKRLTWAGRRERGTCRDPGLREGATQHDITTSKPFIDPTLGSLCKTTAAM